MPTMNIPPALLSYLQIPPNFEAPNLAHPLFTTALDTFSNGRTKPYPIAVQPGIFIGEMGKNKYRPLDGKGAIFSNCSSGHFKPWSECTVARYNNSEQISFRVDQDAGAYLAAQIVLSLAAAGLPPELSSQQTLFKEKYPQIKDKLSLFSRGVKERSYNEFWMAYPGLVPFLSSVSSSKLRDASIILPTIMEHCAEAMPVPGRVVAAMALSPNRLATLGQLIGLGSAILYQYAAENGLQRGIINFNSMVREAFVRPFADMLVVDVVNADAAEQPYHEVRISGNSGEANPWYRFAPLIERMEWGIRHFIGVIPIGDMFGPYVAHMSLKTWDDEGGEVSVSPDGLIRFEVSDGKRD